MADTYTFIGYDGVQQTFEAKAEMTKGRAQETVRTLAARHLTDQEIVDAMAGKNNLLEVRHDGPIGSYSCGENPWYTARSDL